MSTIVGVKEFSVSAQIALLFANSLGFVVSLALNSALGKSFALIPLGLDEDSQEADAINAWIYAAIIVPVVLLVLYGIFRLTQPKEITKSV